MHIPQHRIRCQTVLKLDTKNVKLKPVPSQNFCTARCGCMDSWYCSLMELLCEFGKIYSTVRMGKMEKPLTKDKIQPDLTSMWTEKNIVQLGWKKCLVKFFSQSKTFPVIVALNSSLLITSCAVCTIRGTVVQKSKCRHYCVCRTCCKKLF